jgi:CubicO group peptidase (beta-lactamase class C family)
MFMRGITVSLLALLAFVAANAVAAPLPRSDAGAHAQEFLDTFGKADTAKTRAFVERAYTDEYKTLVPIEGRIQLFLDARARGALEAVELLADEGDKVRLRARHTLTREWRTIELTTEGQRIKRISVSFDWPRTVAEYRSASPDLAAAVTRYVDALEKVRLFSGSVRLERAGTVIVDKAWGYADLNSKARNTPETKINLGSASKMWTAAAVMKLIKDGRLSLDSRLSAFKLGVPLPANAAEITIAHLLSHTSGLGNYFGPKYDAADKASLNTVDDFLPLAVPLENAFKPGSDYAYSNGGFLVLGKIVEIASGLSYSDYVRTVVFQPAGMKDSGCFAVDEGVANLATGYDRTQTDSDPTFESNARFLPRRSVSAGGCYSTTGDMMRLFNFFESGALVSAETLAAFTSKQTPPGAEPYGFGFQLDANGEWYGHSGYFNGVGAVVRTYRKPDGWRFAVLANHRDAAENVGQFLDAAIVSAER